MGRAPCCEKVGLKRGRWTAEEDKILTNYIQANGEGSWRSLPKNAGLLRCGKSCRLRWINYLRTDLKRGNISDEEEEIIIKLHASLGNRWSLIAGHLPGRTDNEVKNYWNSHLSRNIKTFKTSRNQTLSPVAMDLAKAGMASKRRGGRTSRSAMKKKTNFPVKSSSKLVEEHKESKPVNVAVAMPPTPNLDKEALAFSSALSWQEEIENLTLTSPPYQVSEVELLGCGEQERESSNFLLWPGENEQNEFLGTSHEILDSEMLFLNAIVGNEERDPNDDVVAFSGKREENMNEGKLDWDRDCDGGFQGNELWCETDGLLSWLWEGTDNGEGDCNKQLGEEEMDSEKQNAMVEWLLS